ncbi:hypothetical protein, partial [Pseudoalteromonas sp. S4491]|uniref:hypothetical protein n=1 Tax=Pseudoalteromonas sp. S4491 TaxID=579559 RepID=UPI001287BA10
ANDDLAELSEELAEDAADDDVDYDSFNVEQNNPDSNQDVNLDDIDDLLDENNDASTTNVEAELFDEYDFDIDSLIDDAQTEEPVAEANDALENDVLDDALDVDDI